MKVNATHADYDMSLPVWLRARDVIAGEDAVKAGGEKYLPRLESMTSEQYQAYRARASFFNASARTADGYLGLLFRRPVFIKVPDKSSGLGKAFKAFVNDADMLSTSLQDYARNVAREVICVGRAGTLIDWQGPSRTGQGTSRTGKCENRVYASMYKTENIINWRVERIVGRNVLSMVVLAEQYEVKKDDGDADPFEVTMGDQIRVIRLVDSRLLMVDGRRKNVDGVEESLVAAPSGMACQVEVWRLVEKTGISQRRREKAEWKLVETRVPLRLGKPLPLIPFVFHGASHAMPDIDKLPLADVIAVNLDHYRLHADYRHGMHFTALPTAWVSGFSKDTTLQIGSSTAWVTDVVGATAGFLEYTGQGLGTFERAMDRAERQMAILGARLLETQKRVGEAAEAIELRQSGENSILGSLANSVSMSLTHMMQWAYWWNSTETWPDDVTKDEVTIELNTDYSTKGLSAQEIVAVVKAWQSGALSRDSMLDLFRRGEVLPEGRTNEEEVELIGETGGKLVDG